MCLAVVKPLNRFHRTGVAHCAVAVLRCQAGVGPFRKAWTNFRPLQPRSGGLHPSSDGLRTNGLQPNSKLYHSFISSALGAKGITARSKDATRGSWPYYRNKQILGAFSLAYLSYFLVFRANWAQGTADRY